MHRASRPRLRVPLSTLLNAFLLSLCIAVIATFMVAAYNGGSESLGGTQFNLHRTLTLRAILPLAIAIGVTTFAFTLATLLGLAFRSRRIAIITFLFWMPLAVLAFVSSATDVDRRLLTLGSALFTLVATIIFSYWLKLQNSKIYAPDPR